MGRRVQVPVLNVCFDLHASIAAEVACMTPCRGRAGKSRTRVGLHPWGPSTCKIEAYARIHTCGLNARIRERLHFRPGYMFAESISSICRYMSGVRVFMDE